MGRLLSQLHRFKVIVGAEKDVGDASCSLCNVTFSNIISFYFHSKMHKNAAWLKPCKVMRHWEILKACIPKQQYMYWYIDASNKSNKDYPATKSNKDKTSRCLNCVTYEPQYFIIFLKRVMTNQFFVFQLCILVMIVLDL